MEEGRVSRRLIDQEWRALISGTTIKFALRLKVGYSSVVVGQLDNADGAWLFIEKGWFRGSLSAHRFPIVSSVAPTSPSSPAKFCGQCGDARAVNARFCGSCGSAFSDGGVEQETDTRAFDTRVMEMALRLVHLQETGAETDQEFSALAATVVAVARAGLASQQLSEPENEYESSFLDSLETLFQQEKRQIDQIIDGVRGKPGTVLSLALAERIARKAENAEEFTAEEDAALRILLTDAPLTFGYWGPFKRVLKSVPPEKYPAEFARAGSRLTLRTSPSRNHDEEAPYEDVSSLRALGVVGGKKTRAYLLRQQLRAYQALAEHSPESYVRLATEYLVAADAKPSGGDLLEAFILMGGGVFRDKWSRREITIAPDQTMNPPGASGWDAHPDYLMRMWTSVTRRAEFQSFAFQGLTARNTLFSDLTGQQLSLALRSGYEPLMNYAFDQVVQRPDTWTSLSTNQWAPIADRASDELRHELVGHSALPLPAIQYFLELGDSRLSERAVDIFIDRFPDWEGAKYSLHKPLWIQLISAANATQLNRLFDHVFSVADTEKYVSTHLKTAASALEDVLVDSWESHPAVSTLAYLVITVRKGEKFSSPSDESMARALFVLSLYRSYLGPGWSSAWLGRMSPGAIARALVYLNQEGQSREKALPPELAGGSALAVEEILDRVAHFATTSKNPSALLATMWREFVAESDVGAGLKFLRQLATSEHHSIALRAVQADTRREASETAHLCTLIVQETEGTLLGDLRVSLLDRQEVWRAIDFPALVGHSVQLRRALWEMLDSEESDEWFYSVISTSMSESNFLDEMTAEDFRQPNDVQATIMLRLMSKKGADADISRDNIVAQATSQHTEVARVGLGILRSRNLLAQTWLQLVESELPLPVATGFDFLEGLKDTNALTDALLLALDSAVSTVRRRALGLIDTLSQGLDRERFFLALSESRDPDVRRRVAEEALVANWATRKEVELFDDQVLLVRNRARKAKELVKQRLETPLPEGYLPTSERLAILVDLARHGKPRDAEWAYQRLAHLSLAGVPIDGVELSFVNQEAQSG